jgi:hypothetical protein
MVFIMLAASFSLPTATVLMIPAVSGAAGRTASSASICRSRSATLARRRLTCRIGVVQIASQLRDYLAETKHEDLAAVVDDYIAELFRLDWQRSRA